MFQNQDALKISSTPTFSEFDPSIIPFQDQVVDDVLCNFDYKLGAHELLLSGSVGSAKSILGAHLIVRHCIEFYGARVLIGRKALPQLRETIYTKILEHLDQKNLRPGRDYFPNDTMCSVRFANKSEIVAGSWTDKKYKKFRSYELSAAFIEEASENDDEDRKAIMEIKMRVGRLPHIPHKWIMMATNPESPSHWLYKYFFIDKKKTRHVYLSKTEDNPFLPREYIEQLKSDLDPMMARRMLYGEWIEITREIIYHQYSDANYIKGNYSVDTKYPVAIMFDFNIGEGKPLSALIGQFINDEFHVFDEIIIHGARTQDALDEMAGRGLLDFSCEYQIFGDATGESRSTKSIHSDYDIIKKFLANYIRPAGDKVNYIMRVPRSNPPVRERHNIVNSYCKNEAGKIRLFVYEKCKTLNEGMRLTALKKGGNYIEDDSKHFQHCTTALGYWIVYKHREKSKHAIQIFG